MQTSLDELALYDLTCQRLRESLTGRLPDGADMDSTLAAYAYYVCTDFRKQGGDWEATLREYIEVALRDAARETEAERREFALLERALTRSRRSPSRLLDVGAGWGRMARMYDALRLQAVYVEPTTLGTRLMKRSGIVPVVSARGEALPCASETFSFSLIGWVLHHRSPHLDAAAILREVRRVTTCNGLLLSLEPLSARFDMRAWTELLGEAGCAVSEMHEFFEMPNLRGEIQRYALVVATRGHV